MKVNINNVETLKNWLNGKWKFLEDSSIDIRRIIFDPGIGFGKNHHQSQQIIQEFSAFSELPFRTLVGHSRKSFYSSFTESSAQQRDMETLGTSLALIPQGVDILRVHDVGNHRKALKGWLHAQC